MKEANGRGSTRLEHAPRLEGGAGARFPRDPCYSNAMALVRLSRFAVWPFVALGLACAELSDVDWGEILEAGLPLSESQAAEGLREALRVGSERASTSLSKPGGFGDDPLWRLAVPDELDTMATALRGVGLGEPVDRLEASMNRAAEAAAGEAVPVFATAIGEMSIADAFEILRGDRDAATEYFREKTSGELRRRFRPVVTDAMQDTGVYDAYRSAFDAYQALPFAKPKMPSLDAYVVDETLAGLFGRLAEEEARIRRDPGARSTALLQRVFDESETSKRPPQPSKREK